VIADSLKAGEDLKPSKHSCVLPFVEKWKTPLTSRHPESIIVMCLLRRMIITN
jgi:hypothetical protein